MKRRNILSRILRRAARLADPVALLCRAEIQAVAVVQGVQALEELLVTR
jgi:hypothetical protein